MVPKTQDLCAGPSGKRLRAVLWVALGGSFWVLDWALYLLVGKWLRVLGGRQMTKQETLARAQQFERAAGELRRKRAELAEARRRLAAIERVRLDARCYAAAIARGTALGLTEGAAHRAVAVAHPGWHRAWLAVVNGQTAEAAGIEPGEGGARKYCAAVEALVAAGISPAMAHRRVREAHGNWWRAYRSVGSPRDDGPRPAA